MEKTARDAQCRMPIRKPMQSWRAGYREIGPSGSVGGSQKPDLATGEGAGSLPNITAIWTYEGWLYLAVVLDLYSRRVIGWAMAATQDEALIEKAFQMALLARRSPKGVMFHSDRGSQ
jgi:transposase InsO family protein